MAEVGKINYNNFGSKMEIIACRNSRDIDIYFEEYDCIVKINSYSQFEKGTVKCPFEKRTCGVGYLGEGVYTTRVNGELTHRYKTWSSMINRCYNPYRLNEFPTYINVIVEEYLLNFQNYGKWYDENYYECNGELMHLDKDILSRVYGLNNKIYSRETMIFVPQRINYLFTKSDALRGDLPIGVTQKGNKYSVCSINKKYFGLYDNPFDAFEVYKREKESYIKEVADQYRDFIPQKLYDALYLYEVKIND